MNSVIEKFEGVMMPLAGKISGNRYLLAMRDAFSMLLPFIIVTPGQVIGKAGDKIGAFGLDYFGNKAVLTAIIVATIASWIFVKLSKNEKIRIKMPETVPPAVANSFAVLVPVFVTLSVFTVFATILSVGSFMGKTALNDLIYALIQALLMGFSQGLGFSILYQFIVWFFWWFGIHGHNVTAAIQNMVYMPAQLANQAGDASYVFSNGFFEELTLLQVMGLVLAIFIFSKKASWRAVAKVGFPAMLFNIQEPIAFGLPIVLNPILFIPYILSPIANTIIGWLAISTGIVPIFKYVVPWTMPSFFGGLIATGSISGGLLQLVCIAADVCIYAPFVIAAIQNLAKDHDIVKARKQIEEAGKEIGQAHDIQTAMMSAECDGHPVEKSILLIHAQDHFMTSLAVRDMAKLMVDLYEDLKK